MEDVLSVLVNAGVVAGILEALKRAGTGVVDFDRFGHLVSLVVGIATACAGVALGWFDAAEVQITYGDAVLYGLLAGLAASGIFRTAREASRVGGA